MYGADVPLTLPAIFFFFFEGREGPSPTIFFFLVLRSRLFNMVPTSKILNINPKKNIYMAFFSLRMSVYFPITRWSNAPYHRWLTVSFASQISEMNESTDVSEKIGSSSQVVPLLLKKKRVIVCIKKDALDKIMLLFFF